MAREILHQSINRRTLLIATFATTILNSRIVRAFGVDIQLLNIILGRPSNNSIAISILSSEQLDGYVEYGTSANNFVNKSGVLALNPGTPTVIELKNLKAGLKYFYRVRTKNSGQTIFSAGKTNSFSTAKVAGKSFSFTVQGDTHPERAGKMFNADLYNVTMNNISSQQPDFHILLGDDFSIDPLINKGGADQSGVEDIYRTHRSWLAISGGTIPIFLVNGNHEQAAAYLLDGTATNPAVLAGNARLKYFPLPTPDRFYSGDQTAIPNVGLPRDYYSWTWGDALFITLDPYWHSKRAVDNVAGVASDQGGGGGKGGGSGKTTNLWDVGIGDEQYAWLRKTLETSKAKYKFVFAHHVLGTGRGAIEISTNYEWGGADPKGVSTFAKERPNWTLPIHDLMVKNGVSAFFQGHDHIFVTQERDGIIYQSMPNPADDTFTMFNESAYLSGTKAPNSGHVRVTVSPTSAKVEYFLAARTQDSNRQNLSIAHSYQIKPKVSR